MKSGAKWSGAGLNVNLTDAERAEAAMTIWNKEKGTAFGIILAGWCAKVRSAAPSRVPI